MNETTPTMSGYRNQIRKIAQALALAKNECVRSDIARGFSAEQVKMFTDGNLDKRYQKVLDQVELLRDVFDELEELVVEYVKTLPLAAYDTGCSDGERCLRWIEDEHRPTPEQRDYIVCQRSRHAIESIARSKRLAHVQFQDLSGMADRLSDELPTNPELKIHLNPIRFWSKLETRALLDDEAATPANVLFYAAGSDTRTAVLEPAGQTRIRELEAIGPCTLDEWLMTMSDAARDELIEIVQETAQIGLVAFG